jgi:hypothetical protein
VPVQSPCVNQTGLQCLYSLAGRASAAGACSDPPPAEQCCSRSLASPLSRLVVKTPAAVTLLSLSVWTYGPADLPATSYPALARAAVSVGTAAAATGCQLLDGPAPGPPGFDSRGLLCGANGTRIALSFPDAARAGSLPARVAVKVCTRAAAAGREGLRPAVLSLQMK